MFTRICEIPNNQGFVHARSNGGPGFVVGAFPQTTPNYLAHVHTEQEFQDSYGIFHAPFFALNHDGSTFSGWVVY